mgnify:CR=1 FL=1
MGRISLNRAEISQKGTVEGYRFDSIYEPAVSFHKQLEGANPAAGLVGAVCLCFQHSKVVSDFLI